MRVCKAALLALAIAVAGCGSDAATKDQPAATEPPRTVTDLADRTVELPAKIDRVATVGLVPPNNSIVFALGAGGKIVNGPPGGYGETYASYKYLAPHLVDAPPIEAAINDPVNREALLELAPDVVVASDAEMAETLEDTGIPTVVITPSDPEGIKRSVTLLGEVFGEPDRAAAYVKYFDDAVARLEQIGKEVPDPGKPTLLYLSLSEPMRRPALTIDWAAEILGATPVTAHNKKPGWYEFGVEQVQKWDPDVIIALYPSDKQELERDRRFATLRAVRDKRIYVSPTGAQLWGQTTSENPLGILWLAKTLRPEQTADLDMAAETKSFYDRFFGVQLTDDQVAAMLAPGS